MSYPMQVFRSKGGIDVITSNSNEFISNRNFSSVEFSIMHDYCYARRMEMHPLYFTKSSGKILTASEFSDFPNDLRLLATEGILNTTGDELTEYSVLMPLTVWPYGNITGRSGTLFIGSRPVAVNSLGINYSVELKGVESPYGGFESYNGKLDTEEAKREFNVSEEIRNLNLREFKTGSIPRIAASKIGIINQSYRLCSGNYRLSYSENPVFDHKIDFKALTKDIAMQWAAYAMSPSILIHRDYHPENILLNTEGYFLTDFGDIYPFYELFFDQAEYSSGKNLIHELLFRFSNIHKSVDKLHFAREVGKNLGLNLSGKRFDVCIETIWQEYFAAKLHDFVSDNPMVVLDKYLLHINFFREHNEPFFNIQKSMVAYFERQLHFLKHVKGSKIKESLELISERLSFLKASKFSKLDFAKEFLGSEESLLEFLYLPYMKI